MPSLNPAMLAVLKEIYQKGQHELYLKACEKSFHFPRELYALLEEFDYWLEPERLIQSDFWPSARYSIMIPGYVRDSFHIEYRADVDISKLFPAYRLRIFYEIEHPDPDALGPKIANCEDFPQTQEQMRFIEDWEQTAASLGWERLSSMQCDTPLSFLLEQPTAFPQESLWRHLAFDLLELCPDD